MIISEVRVRHYSTSWISSGMNIMVCAIKLLEIVYVLTCSVHSLHPHTPNSVHIPLPEPPNVSG